MKNLIAVFVMALLVLFNTDASAQNGKSKNAEKNNALYTATYDADFRMGNADYSTMILELWKDWDNNTFEMHDYFADTIKMYFPDGSIVSGKKSAMDGAMAYRKTLKAVKSTVHAYVSLYSKEKNETGVSIWGMEENTMADGKVEKRDLHEVWFFNKDGKISTVRQWEAHFKVQ